MMQRILLETLLTAVEQRYSWTLGWRVENPLFHPSAVHPQVAGSCRPLAGRLEAYTCVHFAHRGPKHRRGSLRRATARRERLGMTR
jgi:hypothetical protein